MTAKYSAEWWIKVTGKPSARSEGPENGGQQFASMPFSDDRECHGSERKEHNAKVKALLKSPRRH
jgi:hypothetical protein